MTAADELVLVECVGALGRIRLNRPKSLNSLTPEMIRGIDAGLDRLLADPSVQVIALTGEGEKGLCAGGDIKLLWQGGRDAPEQVLGFWAEEYRLNLRLSRLEKPVVAMMDGITMGGGVGLSVHGSHRVVTERTRFAMPETGIGYFPDVGSTWVLPRAPDRLGYYLGLTGATVSGADALAAGLADAMIDHRDTPAVLERLAAGEAPDEVLGALGLAPGESVLAQNRAMIARCFAQRDVPTIFAALASEPGEFAAQTLSRLRGQSPSSLVLTYELLNRGAALSDLEACLALELGANRMILGEADFYEGIRAAVIDKDRNPKWSPKRLEDVDRAALLARLEAAVA